MPRRVSHALPLLVFLSLVGCANIAPTQGPLLADLPLQPQEDSRAQILPPQQALHWSQLDVEPVQWPAEFALTPVQQGELTRQLTTSLRRHLAPNDPAAPPLRIRTAITRVDTSSPPLNLATTLVLLLPLDRGGAALEIRADDPRTGKALAAARLMEQGDLSDFRGYFSRLGHAKRALDKMVVEFRDIMEQSHGQHTASL